MKTFLTTTTLALLLAAPATAQQNCAPRERVAERLVDRYGETRQSIGLAANNSVVEVWASDEAGTWTITVTMPSGVTCLIASGQAFENLSEELPASGDQL